MTKSTFRFGVAFALLFSLIAAGASLGSLLTSHWLDDSESGSHEGLYEFCSPVNSTQSTSELEVACRKWDTYLSSAAVSLDKTRSEWAKSFQQHLYMCRNMAFGSILCAGSSLFILTFFCHLNWAKSCPSTSLVVFLSLLSGAFGLGLLCYWGADIKDDTGDTMVVQDDRGSVGYSVWLVAAAAVSQMVACGFAGCACCCARSYAREEAESFDHNADHIYQNMNSKAASSRSVKSKASAKSLKAVSFRASDSKSEQSATSPSSMSSRLSESESIHDKL